MNANFCHLIPAYNFIYCEIIERFLFIAKRKKPNEEEEEAEEQKKNKISVLTCIVSRNKLFRTAFAV